MTAPEMPWYPEMERALQPLSPYSTLILVLLAVITLWVAFKGDSVAKLAFLVYLVSP